MKINYFGERIKKVKSSERAEAMPAAIITAIVSSMLLLGIASAVSLVVQEKSDSEGNVALTTSASNIDVSLRSDITQASYISASAKLKQPATKPIGPSDVILSGVNMHIPTNAGECKVIRWNVNGNTVSRDLTIYTGFNKDNTFIKCDESSTVVAKRTKVFADDVNIDAPFKFHNQVGREITFTAEQTSLDKVNVEYNKQLTLKGVQKLNDSDFNELNKLMGADSYKAGFQNPAACAMDAPLVWVDANKDGIKQPTEMVCPPAEADTINAAWNSLKIAKVSVAFQMQSDSGEVAKRDIAQNSSIPLYADAAEAEASVAGSAAYNRPATPNVTLSTANIVLGANYTINWDTVGTCAVDTVRSYKIYENNVLIRTQATQGYTKNYTNSATEYLNYVVQIECVRGALVVNSDMSAPAIAKVIPAAPALVINNQPAATNAALNSNLTSTATCLYGTTPQYNVVQAVTSFGTANATLPNLNSVNLAINTAPFSVVEGARYQYRVESWCISTFDKSTNTNANTNPFTTLVTTPAAPLFTAPIAGATNVATNATVTWNAVVCATGTTTKYYTVKDINAGVAITPQVLDSWNTDLSYVSSNTQGNSVGYSVQARCEGSVAGVNSSATTPSKVQYTTVISAPAAGAPLFTSPAAGATNIATNATVTWSAAVCAPSTTTQYYATKNINANAAITPQIVDDWTTDLSYVTNNNQGSTVGYTVAARCAGPNANSGSSATDALKYTTGINAPAAPAFTAPAAGATNVAVNAAVTWSTVTCAAGTTVQYYATKNVNAGAAVTPTVINNWIAGNSLTSNNTQGNTVGYTVAARCVGPNLTSNSSATSTLAYTTAINAPAAPLFTSPAAGATNIKTNAAVTWSVAVCATGTTVQYYTTKNMDLGVAMATPTVIGNWIAGNSLVTSNNEGVQVGYTVAARCAGPNANSGSSPTTSLTYSTEVTAPLMPTFTSPAKNATDVTPNVNITWSAVTCGPGMTVQYYMARTMNSGVVMGIPSGIIAWTNDVSAMVSNTEGNMVGFTVSARCAGPNATSLPSPSDNLTFTTRVNAPAAPVFTAPAEGATNVATDAALTWSTVVCPATTTVKYYRTKNMDKGVGIAAQVLSNWTAGNAATTSNIEGNRVGYTIAARCEGPNASSVSSATNAVTFTTTITAPSAIDFIAPTPDWFATRAATNATIAWSAATCATGTTAQYYMVKDRNYGNLITPIVLDDWNTDLSYVTSNPQGSMVAYVVKARCAGPNVNSAETSEVARIYTTNVDAPGWAWSYNDGWQTVYWNPPTVGCAAGVTLEHRLHQSKADNTPMDEVGGWGTGYGSWLPSYHTGGYPQWAFVESRCTAPNASSDSNWGNVTKWIKNFDVAFSTAQQWRRVNVWASCPAWTSVGDFHLYVAADGWGGARGVWGSIQTDEGASIADAQGGGGGNTGWLYMRQTQNTQWNAAIQGGTTYNWGYWGNNGWGSNYDSGGWGGSMSGTYWNAAAWGNWAHWWTGVCVSPYMHVYDKNMGWVGGGIRNAGNPGAHYDAWPKGRFYTQAGNDATQ